VVTPIAESLRAPAGRIELLASHVAERKDRPWHENRSDLEEIQMLGDEIRCAAEDLLYLTRIADGTLDIRRTETSVGRILSGVLPRLRRIARARDAEILTVHVDEEAPLFTDARLMMRALRGFIGRSLHQGGVTVTLTATQSGDDVKFVIIDSATGNEAALLEKVLQPDSIARAQTGEFVLPSIDHLPTLLSVHLFRALGGHVEVQSSPSLGTQVTLTLLS
jgi:signal transduction histidine kinase